MFSKLSPSLVWIALEQDTIDHDPTTNSTSKVCGYSIGQSIDKFLNYKTFNVYFHIFKFLFILRIFVRFDYYAYNLGYIHYLGYSHKPIEKGKEAHHLDIECFSYRYSAF